MKGEIAVLKRKIGDHSIKSGPAVAMATETIQMPKKEKEGTNAAEAVPAETITTQDIRPPDAPSVEVASRKPKSKANDITAKAPKPGPPAVEPPAALNGAEASASAPPPAEPATASIALSDSELPPPARHTSPLAAIIAAPPVKPEPEADAPEGLVPADTIPALTELPTELPVSPLPELEIQPELDPKLGLIYKSRPATADDLTVLKGISRVLEQRLNEIGIYTYAQIAAWDEDRVKEFSARLAFKDRIRREHWVAQASKLAATPATV
jgi:NADH-quinone oxidoreductase subunit E